MERGSRPDRQSQAYAWGMQVGPEELDVAKQLLADALKVG
jgi:hypothetical protein